MGKLKPQSTYFNQLFRWPMIRWPHFPISRSRRSPDSQLPNVLEGLPPLLLLLAQLSAAASAFVTLFLFFSFGNDLWHRLVASCLIHGNKCQVSRRHMTRGSGNVVFHPALYPNLHRSLKRAVH